MRTDLIEKIERQLVTVERLHQRGDDDGERPAGELRLVLNDLNAEVLSRHVRQGSKKRR